MSKFEATWNEARHHLGVEEIDGAHRDFITQVAELIAASDVDSPCSKH